MFKKFEQQIRGMIIAIYLRALVPNFEIEEKTKKNIIKGKQKINIFLIDKLMEYKNDFTFIDIKSAKNSEKSTTPKKTRGSAKFLIFRVSPIYYLLENWNLLRAFLLPYFFLSTTLESLVRNPVFFKIP